MLAQQEPVCVRGPEHSRQGVASFAYALFVVYLHVVMLGTLGLLYLKGEPAGPLLGLAGKIYGMTLLAWLGSLVALLRGVSGLREPGGKKSLAAWGVALNGLFFVGILVATWTC